jgi:type VII secretion protein EccE
MQTATKTIPALDSAVSAPAQRRGPARTDAAVHPRPGRIGSVSLIRVIFLEAAVVLGAVPFLIGHPMWGTVAFPLASGSAIGALFGGRNRWLGQLSLIRADFRKRRALHVPQRPGEAALAPLRETFPALRTVSASSRSGDPVGMIGDGTFLTGVLLVTSRAEPLRAPRATQPLPLGTIAAALSDSRISAAGIQIVTHTQLAPTPFLPSHAVAVRSYQEIVADVPAQRSTWIAVRLDPPAAASAIEARGGGSAGLQRTLLTVVQRVAGDLVGAGFDATPLSEPELIAALGTACVVDPLVGTTPGAMAGPRRTEETKRTWRCDDRWHTTYWLEHLPTLGADTTPDLFAALTGVPALATTLSVNAARGTGGSVGFSVYVRIATRSDGELAEAARELEQRAATLGIGLTRLDGEQLPGLVATIPLGGEA